MTSVTIQLHPAVAERLRELAEMCNMTTEQYIARAAEKDAETHPRDGYLDALVRRHNNRTPEEVAAAHARVDATTRPARPLPPGETLADVVEGTWPGTESDAQIHNALRRLS